MDKLFVHFFAFLGLIFSRRFSEVTKVKNSYSNDVKNFVLKNLINYSHSKLIADESFVEYTGLNSAHALANYIKKHKITMQDVYRFGIDNGLIRYEISFIAFLS